MHSVTFFSTPLDKIKLYLGVTSAIILKLNEFSLIVYLIV